MAGAIFSLVTALALYNVGCKPSYIKQYLKPMLPAYPLASLDVSGQ